MADVPESDAPADQAPSLGHEALGGQNLVADSPAAQGAAESEAAQIAAGAPPDRSSISGTVPQGDLLGPLGGLQEDEEAGALSQQLGGTHVAEAEGDPVLKPTLSDAAKQRQPPTNFGKPPLPDKPTARRRSTAESTTARSAAAEAAAEGSGQSAPVAPRQSGSGSVPLHAPRQSGSPTPRRSETQFGAEPRQEAEGPGSEASPLAVEGDLNPRLEAHEAPPPDELAPTDALPAPAARASELNPGSRPQSRSELEWARGSSRPPSGLPAAQQEQQERPLLELQPELQPQEQQEGAALGPQLLAGAAADAAAEEQEQQPQRGAGPLLDLEPSAEPSEGGELPPQPDSEVALQPEQPELEQPQAHSDLELQRDPGLDPAESTQAVWDSQSGPPYPGDPASEDQGVYGSDGQPLLQEQQEPGLYQAEGKLAQQEEQGFRPEGEPEQSFSPEGDPEQGFSPEGEPEQGFSPEGEPEQSFSPEGEPEQGFILEGGPEQKAIPREDPEQGFIRRVDPEQGFISGEDPDQGFVPPGDSEQSAVDSYGQDPGSKLDPDAIPDQAAQDERKGQGTEEGEPQDAPYEYEYGSGYEQGYGDERRGYDGQEPAYEHRAHLQAGEPAAQASGLYGGAEQQYMEYGIQGAGGGDSLITDQGQGPPASHGRPSSQPRGGASYSRDGAVAGGVHGGYSRGEAGDGGGGGAAMRPQQQQRSESDVLLAAERERFSQQLQMEARAREELEDMILRIEKHFKAEQAARKKAEELLQAAISAELEAKNRLEDLLKKRREEQRVLEEERNGIKRERNALEVMRQEFETELQAARSEVAKAQDALAASEDRIRAAEAVDRARLESEYQAKIATLQDEIGRLRDELTYRTQLMTAEMTRWQQQAHMTAAAVLEAKNEVLERKKELDCTKEKMDRLLDKLYIGRERGLELSGAIAAAQSFAQHAAGMGVAGGPGGHMAHGLASMAGIMAPPLLMAQANGGAGGARGGGIPVPPPPLLSPTGPAGGGGSAGGYSNIPKLPPVNLRPPPLFGEVGSPAPGPRGGPRRSAPGSHMGYEGPGGSAAGPGGYLMPAMPPGMLPGHQLGNVGGGGLGPMGMGPMGMGPMGFMGGGIPPMMPGMAMGMIPQAGILSGGGPGGAAGGGGAGSGGDGADPYAHVQSRFAQPSDPGKKGRAGNGKGAAKKPLDRFEESKRDEARLAAMAKRWG